MISFLYLSREILQIFFSIFYDLTIMYIMTKFETV